MARRSLSRITLFTIELALVLALVAIVAIIIAGGLG
jgi:hypothetical protein